ncbi:hypothetical protein GF325_11910 [Candidatus Bathyarchaeota archaeon]|nr:hypothetical protein [Candidatus Bathyarchaeota archaeon]
MMHPRIQVAPLGEWNGTMTSHDYDDDDDNPSAAAPATCTASWAGRFNHDPVEPLLSSGLEDLVYFTKRDLLGKQVSPIKHVWELPAAKNIVRKQQEDGSWKPTRKRPASGVNYRLIETWRKTRVLVEQFQFTKVHPTMRAAAEYILSCQTSEGDIRGILANQYAPYYTGAILYLLIKAGYASDPRIEMGIEWLLHMRQDDGGWLIGSPGIQTRNDLRRAEINKLTSSKDRETITAFDRTMPFSAAGTGMVLRAFSVHPRWHKAPETHQAATLLKSKLFKRDNWRPYQHPDNWLRFQFPFWWTNLVSALDSLSLIGIPASDPSIKEAFDWLVGHQQEDGTWKLSYSRVHANRENSKTRLQAYWVSLSICRIFKRFLQHHG